MHTQDLIIDQLTDLGIAEIEVSGDATTLHTAPFTPSAGNLWAQPGVTGR